MIRSGLQELPVQLSVGIPFRGLAELPAHEQQLLPREHPLIPEQQPQVRKPPPIIARHPAQQRALAVHHLVVGERQDEILVMVIEHREREFVLMVLPMNRVVAEITERVVHPAHVPLKREAQPAQIGRPRHLWPGGGLFGDSHHAWKLGVREVVELPDEINGFEILAPAELVGDPLARLPRIVQVEHRGHRIHPQAVHVKAVAPEERIGQQEVHHLMPPVVEDQRAPILVRSFARVLVLVKGGAVELGQRPVIARKVRRHPVNDHANAGLVQRVHQILEILGRAIATRRRVEAHHLVAPRRVIRVLGHRHEFHMGEPHLLHVLDQRLGQRAVAR